MAGNNNCYPIFHAQHPEQIPQRFHAGRIQTVCRLIKHQKFWSAKNCAGDAKALLHSQGIPLNLLVTCLQKPKHFKGVIHTAGRMIAHIFAVQSEVLPAAHMLIKTRKLDDACHSLKHLIGGRRQGFPKQLDRPISRFPEICEHLHHRRLTCAVWPQKPIDFPLFYMETDILYNLPAINDFRQLVRLYHICIWHPKCLLSLACTSLKKAFPHAYI